MEIFCFFFAVLALLSAFHCASLVRKTKKQISEMSDALSDIKNGNGNRRILAKPHELAAPLVYQINDIVLSYESKLSAFQQMEAANKRLMTSLSHDVRTPLTTLIGYLDAVQKRIVTGSAREAYLETAQRKAHDLKAYIEVLFDWFKLNSNEFPLKTAPVEITELTRTILADWIPIFENRKTAYDISIPESPFFVLLDPEGYRRILNNLIQNTVTHSGADQITLSLCGQEQHVTIQISDNGIGIKPEHLEHIFERLYQCDHDHSPKGSGLGLSIAYQLTEKMHGKIVAESEPEKGSTFTLSFLRDSSYTLQG